MYVAGMAPRVDKLEAFLANKPPRHQYIVMRAYARGLEIELRAVRQNSTQQGRRSRTLPAVVGASGSEGTCTTSAK